MVHIHIYIHAYIPTYAYLCSYTEAKQHVEESESSFSEHMIDSHLHILTHAYDLYTQEQTNTLEKAKTALQSILDEQAQTRLNNMFVVDPTSSLIPPAHAVSNVCVYVYIHI
jgi:hypothetical protein